MQIFIYRINFTFIQPHTELSSDLLPAASKQEREFLLPLLHCAFSSLDLKISFFRLPKPAPPPVAQIFAFADFYIKIKRHPL